MDQGNLEINAFSFPAHIFFTADVCCSDLKAPSWSTKDHTMKYLSPLSPPSVTETVSRSSGGGGAGEDEDQALQDRMAKREERRQRRMREALERQRQLDPTVTEGSDGVTMEKNNAEEERPSSWRRGRYRDSEDAEEKTETYSSRREEKGGMEAREEEEAAPEGGVEAQEDEEEEQKVEVVEDKPRRSYLREQVSHSFIYLSHLLYFLKLTVLANVMLVSVGINRRTEISKQGMRSDLLISSRTSSSHSH